MKRLMMAVLTAALAISTAAPLTAMTLETGPLPRTQPTVLGVVSSINSHAVGVKTGDGEDMMFEYDSRSLLPTTLDAGTRVRVEFDLLDSGLHRAQRVVPLTVGSKDWEMLDQQLASANWDEQSGETMVVASTTTPEAQQTEPVAVVQDQEATSSTATETQTSTDAENRDLPGTASELPWLLAAGLLLLVAAAGLWLVSRRRAV